MTKKSDKVAASTIEQEIVASEIVSVSADTPMDDPAFVAMLEAANGAKERADAAEQKAIDDIAAMKADADKAAADKIDAELSSTLTVLQSNISALNKQGGEAHSIIRHAWAKVGGGLEGFRLKCVTPKGTLDNKGYGDRLVKAGIATAKIDGAPAGSIPNADNRTQAVYSYIVQRDEPDVWAIVDALDADSTGSAKNYAHPKAVRTWHKSMIADIVEFASILHDNHDDTSKITGPVLLELLRGDNRKPAMFEFAAASPEKYLAIYAEKGIAKSINRAKLAEIDAAKTDKAETAETETAESETGILKFGDRSIADAAEAMLDMLKLHPEASKVLDTLIELFETSDK